MLVNVFRMGLKRLLCLVAFAAALTGCDSSGQAVNSNVYRWPKQNPPLLLDTRTQILSTASFRGKVASEETQSVCGIECQSRLLPMDQTEQERMLGYETMYENGTRTHTDVTLQGFSENSTGLPPAKTRWKRQVYGADGRFVISDSQYVTKYPFSSAVRLSTNCTGVLVSSKHVLTAAHCIHDGRNFLESFTGLKVGFLQPKKKGRGRRRGRGRGRGRGGSRRSGRRREGETGEQKGAEQLLEAGLEQNSLDGGSVRRRDGGKGRRQRGKRAKAFDTSLSRGRRSAEPRQRPVLRWAQVQQARIPQGWLRNGRTSNPVSPDYDYALLELKRPIGQRHMKLGVAPSSAPLARIHFSGFDADKSPSDGGGDERVIYRFCSVAKESDDLMYQHCDAQAAATGAGVYIRLRQEVGDGERKGKWQRRVIGVFSGHQWVEMEGGELADFNVAVRITPAKYAQICHWVHGDPDQCREL